PLIWLGVVGTVLVAGYVTIFALNSAALDRYPTGFVIQHCPACEAGHLEVEERFYRAVGIPRARRTVRCSHCRSVLREVGSRKWRYAVDPHVNPALFDQANDKIFTEAALKKLAPDPVTGVFPHYIEDE